ncbi:hypothetical protein PHLGIDRAFT_17168, partial [Phlebiopsis gigantea 11061_1 CR5-6]
CANSHVIAELYGITAVDAYKAYHDPSTLTSAEVLWNLANQYVVQPADAANGNDTYRIAAELSASFVRAQLYDQVIVLDHMNLTSCSLSTPTPSYNTGFLIDALSTLTVTNSSWTPFLNTLVSAAVPFTQWTGTDGVNIESQKAQSLSSIFRCRINGPMESQLSRSIPIEAYLFRGLYSAWLQVHVQSNSSEMANFIETYVNTQNWATTQGSNLYSGTWHGPPSDGLSDFGQVDAAFVLNAALAFSIANASPGAQGPGFPSSTTSSFLGTTPTPTNGLPNTTHHPDASRATLSTGGLVGVVISGLFIVSILVIVVVLLFNGKSHQIQPALNRGSHWHKMVTQSASGS